MIQMGRRLLNMSVMLLAVFLMSCSLDFTMKNNYNDNVKTGGALEAKYLADGPHTVNYRGMSGLQDFEKFEIYYPADIADGSEKWPVVIFSNGTGVKASSYTPVLARLASWGFIVMATEEENSWNGFSSEMCLRLIVKLNETEKVEGWNTNPFYGHVDTGRIGVSGHSQGGVGVINAATENKNGNMIKAIWSASPTNMELAESLMWDYDSSKISCPVFLISSTGSADENLVVSGVQLKSIYDTVPDTVTKIMARRKDADHGDMLSYADGYMTAWFMWQLNGDAEAAGAFVGGDAEILTNGLYRDQHVNIVP